MKFSCTRKPKARYAGHRESSGGGEQVNRSSPAQSAVFNLHVNLEYRKRSIWDCTVLYK